MNKVSDEPQTWVVKTMHGLEPALMDELKQLGLGGITLLKRAVAFTGTRADMYRAQYSLRTALRILMPIHQFPAYREENLYEGIREIDWSRYMGVTDTLAVDATVQGEVFRHSQYAALLTKDAIVDQFRDRYLRRPSVNPGAPTLRINLHINGTRCEVSLDASGDSLHKRGYRKDTVEAPLNEVLAAGMIQLSGWKGERCFIDPMCGSGTLPIEAAMVATRTPAQYFRGGFGFFKWPDFDEKLWKTIKQHADEAIIPSAVPIIASDIDSRARNASSVNTMAAGMEATIQIEKTAFEKRKAPAPEGLLMTNPPYDERLKMPEIEQFYKNIGDTLKQQWSGWEAWVISANREALKHLGLRPSKRITLFNGALDCSFQQFELYEGSKRKGEPEIAV